MDLLKKDYWWVWLILMFITQGLAIFALAASLHAYDKNAWYANWIYWVIGIICCLFPAMVLLTVLMFQLTVVIADRLEVPGREIYTSPYTWILCLVVPILGWTLLIVMELYLAIEILVQLYRGKGEQYM